MIRIVADNFIKPEDREKFLTLAKELVDGTEETICGAVALGRHEMTLNQLERKGMEATWV